MGNCCSNQQSVTRNNQAHYRPKPVNSSTNQATNQYQQGQAYTSTNTNYKPDPNAPSRSVYPAHRPDFNQNTQYQNGYNQNTGYNQNSQYNQNNGYNQPYQQVSGSNNYAQRPIASNKPTVIYVLGGPGSGKGTQCKAITDSYPGKFYHISTGSLLRDATQSPSPEHAAVIQAMKQGKMVPSRYVVELIKQKIWSMGNNVIYILDGFPRNTENLEAWNNIIGNDVDVRFLLYFQCTQDQMRKRLLGRAKSSGRVDDNPQTIEKRIVIFNDQTRKMLDNFRRNSGNIVSVNANQSVDAVTRDVRNVISQYRLVL